MRATSGIFRCRADAERASRRLKLTGLSKGRITLLVPGEAGKQVQRVPVSNAEQPGAGKALGAFIGAAMGLAVGFELGAVSAVIRGVGPIIAIGFWGATFLALVGAAVGAAAGSAVENAMTDGLPEDELFVYEDALRKGRSVVLAFPDDRKTTESARALLAAEGAESIDEARKHWWIGLRSAEQEHYGEPGRVARASRGKDEVNPMSSQESWDSRAGTRRAPPIPGKEREVGVP